MAYVTDIRIGGTTIADRVNALRADWADKIARRRLFRTTLNELSALSNRELNDLGIARSEIKNIAYQAAYA